MIVFPHSQPSLLGSNCSHLPVHFPSRDHSSSPVLQISILANACPENRTNNLFLNIGVPSLTAHNELLHFCAERSLLKTVEKKTLKQPITKSCLPVADCKTCSAKKFLSKTFPTPFRTVDPVPPQCPGLDPRPVPRKILEMGWNFQARRIMVQHWSIYCPLPI